MGLRDNFFNMLGVDVQTNRVGETQKTSNMLLRGARDFLIRGNREQLLADWSDIKMSDQDMYRGYSYAAIQKRGNKVASLAKENLKTTAKTEVIDKYQDEEQEVEHPYIKLIRNSKVFTEKQFWKNISIYLDLAGRYYLGVVRNEIKPRNDNLPTITTDIKELIMLNPYEIHRVIRKDGTVGGYVERKSDGRYREWPLYQIIEMKELNPFEPEKSQWAITDAAKEAVYTLNQSGDYTRQSISGNIDAPGIITTDLVLKDEDFANFVSRVQQHRKGEPLFGNGAGAIQWESMQVDLDKAALMDINEINRTTLFAISGTSKTSLGIEQSGTTRETARVQSEQFVSDTAQPRLEDIVDFLNLDYRRHYKNEYEKTGYQMYVESAVGRDYNTETQAVGMRQAQAELAFGLIEKGFTTTSAYQYAQGAIKLEDLELKDGLEEPKSDNPDEGEGENSPTSPSEPPQGGSDTNNGNNSDSEQNSLEMADNDDLSDLTPHSDLVENSGKEKSENRIQKDESEKIGVENVCCPDCENKIEDLLKENKDLEEHYNSFLAEVREIEKSLVDKACRKVTVNAFEEDDILGPRQKKSLVNQLKELLKNYWGYLFLLFGQDTTAKRNMEFNTNETFTLNNAIQNKILDNSEKVAKGHIETIANDVLETANRAFTKTAEEAAADLIVTAYREDPDKYKDYFSHEPTRADALKSIQKTDILERNKRIYDKANAMAYEGYKRSDIIKAIRQSYPDIAENRATLIASNETSRAFGRSQYEADLQFLQNTGKLAQAYKRLVSRRPANEQDKICPFCASLIERTKNNPIPFTEPFLKFGDSIEVFDNGVVKNFTANFESIEASTIHPGCFCHYELIIKENNSNGDKVSNVVIPNVSSRDNCNNDSDELDRKEVDNYNDKHEPAGSPKGGQFAKKDGGGSGQFIKGDSIEKLAESNQKIISELKAEESKILDGAYQDEEMARFFSDNPEKARIASQEQLEQIDRLSEKARERISKNNREYWKAQGEYTEPGFYKDKNDNIYEVVEEWGSQDGGPIKQVSYPLEATHLSSNQYLLYDGEKGLSKISESEARGSIPEGSTLQGISRRDEITLNTYSQMTPQNQELRKGKALKDIRSAQELASIINRTKSPAGTFYRGFSFEDVANAITKLKKGDSFEDKGFMSTSRNRQIAQEFSDNSGVKVLMKVVSKGGFGKSIDVAPYSKFPGEQEELFNAGSKGKVTDVSMDNGYKIVTVELD